MTKIQIPEIQDEQTTFLFCTEPGTGTDKEYHAYLRRQGEQWVYQYANGKRGKVGQAKTLKGPFSFAEAYVEYVKTVASKMKSGYTENENGVRFSNSELAGRASGHQPQQCLPVSIETADSLNLNSAWGAQEKANGERRMIRVEAGKVQGINKRGLFVNIPETWEVEFQALGSVEIDGEAIGEVFHAFDLLRDSSGQDLRRMSLNDRYKQLVSLMEAKSGVLPSMKLLKMHFSSEEKTNLLADTEKNGGEGVVYKMLELPYISGVRLDTLKYKFFESSTCIVIDKNVQRSARVGLRNSSGDLVEICNVTYPESLKIEPGSLMEVQYLYYNPGGGFEIPTCLGLRNDIAIEECTFTQITRLKPGVEMDADGQLIEKSARIAERC